MGEVDTVVEDGRFAEDHVFRAYPIGLFGVFSTIKPSEVADSRTIREMGDDTLFARTHGETLETEDMSHDLHIGHVASQFMDGVDLRTVHIFIRIVFEQVAIGFDAKFVAQHLLAIRANPRQELDVLIEDIQFLEVRG